MANTEVDKARGDKDAGGKGGAVARRGVLSPADSDTFKRFLAAADDAAEDMDPEQVQMEIIARILDAKTVDEVLGGGTAVHARDYLYAPFKLLDVKFNRSTYEQGAAGFYAVLDAVTREGERVAITCGAHRVITQAWKLVDLDALPVDLELHQSERPTANGYHVMWLEKASKPF